MILFLLQATSIRKVKYTSNPFRTQLRAGKRKTFLAVCWLIVLAPFILLPLCLSLYSPAFLMALKSNPKCSSKFWSSAAIAASGIALLISSMEIQSFFNFSFLSFEKSCSPHLMSISGVKGTGTKRNSITETMLRTKNHFRIFATSFKMFLNQDFTLQTKALKSQHYIPPPTVMNILGGLFLTFTKLLGRSPNKLSIY